MPRIRTSTEPPKRRARIGTREECRKEIQRTIYRADNGEITPAYATHRIDWLNKYINTMPEVDETTAFIPTVVNVNSVASGQQLMPGLKVLAPFEEVARAWEAFRAYANPREARREVGTEHPWQTYLKETKAIWTQEAFDHLSAQIPPEPKSNDDDDKVVPFRPLDTHGAPIDQAWEPQNEKERRLLAELESLTREQLLDPEQLLERARRAGYVDMNDLKNELNALVRRMGGSDV